MLQRRSSAAFRNRRDHHADPSNSRQASLTGAYYQFHRAHRQEELEVSPCEADAAQVITPRCRRRLLSTTVRPHDGLPGLRLIQIFAATFGRLAYTGFNRCPATNRSIRVSGLAEVPEKLHLAGINRNDSASLMTGE